MQGYLVSDIAQCMTFAQWSKTLKRGGLARLSRDSGISWATLMRAKAGEPVRGYDLCRKISEATEGAVSAEEVAAGDAAAAEETARRKQAWLARQAERARQAEEALIAGAGQ